MITHEIGEQIRRLLAADRETSFAKKRLIEPDLAAGLEELAGLLDSVLVPMAAGGRGPKFRIASGRYWHPLDPLPQEFEWSDVAAGLSRICRFTGQLPPEHVQDHETYTVAQHCVLAWRLAHQMKEPVDVQKAVALHDAAEALWGLGDVVAPVKRMPWAKLFLGSIERRVEDAIADKAGLPRGAFAGERVKLYDVQAYVIESVCLRGIKPDDAPPRDPAFADVKVQPRTPGVARRQFDEMLAELGIIDGPGVPGKEHAP